MVNLLSQVMDQFVKNIIKKWISLWNSRAIDDPLVASSQKWLKTAWILLLSKINLRSSLSSKLRFFWNEIDKTNFFRQIYRFLSYKWYFDAIYNEFINRPLIKWLIPRFFRSLDKGVLELFGPYGISYVLFSNAP